MDTKVTHGMIRPMRQSEAKLCLRCFAPPAQSSSMYRAETQRSARVARSAYPEPSSWVRISRVVSVCQGVFNGRDLHKCVGPDGLHHQPFVSRGALREYSSKWIREQKPPRCERCTYPSAHNRCSEALQTRVVKNGEASLER